MGLVFKFRRGCLCAIQLYYFETKLPNLELKTRPKQLLGSLPVDIALPGQWNRIPTKNILCKSRFSVGGKKIWRLKLRRETPKMTFHDWNVFYQFLWLYLIATPRNTHKTEGSIQLISSLRLLVLQKKNDKFKLQT